jgi:hypothetical protein
MWPTLALFVEPNTIEKARLADERDIGVARREPSGYPTKEVVHA